MINEFIVQALPTMKKQKAAVQKKIKSEMDRHAYFNRAAMPYIDSEKIIKQQENYTHFDEIAKEYDAAKERVAEQRAAQIAEQKRLDEAKQSQKAAAKSAKKNK